MFFFVVVGTYGVLDEEDRGLIVHEFANSETKSFVSTNLGWNIINSFVYANLMIQDSVCELLVKCAYSLISISRIAY